MNSDLSQHYLQGILKHRPPKRQKDSNNTELLPTNLLHFPFSEGRESPSVVPDELQQVRLNLVDPDDCADQINGYLFGHEVTDRMICAGRDISGKGVCQVDLCIFLNVKTSGVILFPLFVKYFYLNSKLNKKTFQ